MTNSVAEDLEQLYRSRYLTFRNGMAAITGSYESARDVVQEAFARALRDRDQYRGDGPLVAWVWRIAVRVALESRRNGHELTLEELVADAPAPASPERDPALADALRELSPRRRLVVFLRYFADLSYAEIAALCEISEGTVAATLAHAHADLSKALQAQSEGVKFGERQHAD
ncbi:MAG TPA: RNA polymerase sigma factor [Solirubrobacteraceae bacterium]|nr:RNA polymerase sigma factor [Solirubrobacteraceae bacterium]